MHRFSFRLAALGALASLAFTLSCSDDTTAPIAPGFLGGTSSDHEVGVVVNSLARSLTLFQHGSPATQQQIALGSSSTITPTGMSVRGRRAAVPLGDAASVALVDLQGDSITRFFTFASGNATGSAFVNDTTVVVANLLTNVVGRFTTGQTVAAITKTVAVAPQPTAVAVTGGRVFVVSSNLDQNYQPIGNGIVTAIDPATMTVVGTATMGGTNSTDVGVGPDGLLYVVNSGDFVGLGSLTVLNGATMQVVTTINVGVGPGAVFVDPAGMAYISGFLFGTTIWNTTTRQFVRGPDNPICAKLANGNCRGAFAATTDKAGNVYQAFFGTSSLPARLFVYKAGTFALTDSVAVGAGPSALTIRVF
jgi:YVTN family beta-propeller protein